MKKKRPILLCSLTIVLMCLLTISSTFQTICVKTLGDNYLDALTINQIVDLVIDQDENIQFKQLQQLQIDLKMNKELYNFNCYAFDYTIRHINDEKIQLDQKKINQFSKSCYTIIKENHDTNVKVSDISKIVKENQFWKKLTHSMKKKMKSFSQAFIFIYSMVESLIFKMILILLILVVLRKIYALYKKAFSLFLTVIFIVKSLVDYLMILSIELSKTFYIKMLNIPITSIETSSYLLIATLCLTVGMFLLIGHILKTE